MRFSSSWALVLACGAVFIPSACSGGTATTPAASTVSTDLRSNGPGGIRNSSLATPRPPLRLAVTEFFNPSTFDGVVVLNRSYKQVQTITDGAHFPNGATYDSSGNLYIANTAGGNVTEYNKKGTLTFTYSTSPSGLANPGRVAVDQSGNVYAGGGDGGSASSIVEFAQDSKKPLTSCSIGHLIGGMAVDAKGHIFVPVDPFKGSGAGQVLEFKHGLTGCKATTLGVQFKYGGAEQLAIDKHHNLVVSDLYVGVDIIPPPYTKVSSTITAGLKEPLDVALNKQQNLVYIVNDNYPNNDVVVDTYPSGTNVTTLGASDGITEAEGVAAYR